MLKEPARMSWLFVAALLFVVFRDVLDLEEAAFLLGLDFEALLAAFTISFGGRTGFLSITGRGTSTGFGFGIG